MRAAILVTIVLMAACSSGASNPDSGASSGGASYSVSNGIVRFDGDAEAERAVLNGASRSQVELIRSGEISFADHEQSLLIAFECARERGVMVENLGPIVDGEMTRLDYRIPASASGMSEEDILAGWDECYDLHAGAIDSIWQVAHDPYSRPGVLEAKLETLAECMRRNGIEVGEIQQGQITDAVRLADELLASGGENCVETSGLIQEQ